MTVKTGRIGHVMHVEPGAGDVVDVLGDIATFKVPGTASGGSLIIAEIVVHPGGGPPGLHAHPTEEAFYVIAGDFEVRGVGEDGEPFTAQASAGSVIYVPSEAIHTFRNVGTTPGRLLVIYTSSELEEMARELGRLPVDAPPERATVMEILTRHGIRFIGAAHAQESLPTE